MTRVAHLAASDPGHPARVAAGLTRLLHDAEGWTHGAHRNAASCGRLAGMTAADDDAGTLATGRVRDALPLVVELATLPSCGDGGLSPARSSEWRTPAPTDLPGGRGFGAPRAATTTM